MHETRVNLKRLLEDIRDSYPIPRDEIIITELVANSLDSGASEIRFFVNSEAAVVTVLDNGRGMSGRNLEEYHDIASTTKVRGKGIGFAGVGVKLSLLMAKEVVTETKTPSSHKATRWKLQNTLHAPWEYIAPSGHVDTHSGTAVSIVLNDVDSQLLNSDFIKQAVYAHFYPILDREFMKDILSHVYKDGIGIFVNGEKLESPEDEASVEKRYFLVKYAKRKPFGVGYILKTKEELPEEKRGIAISTYGKVIKRGWDWLGIMPRNPMRLTGTVEIPEISEILTLNKADFLKDAASLKKYYVYRKAILGELKEVLKDFGEITEPKKEAASELRPLEKELENVLNHMMGDFPELSPLIEKHTKKVIPDEAAPDAAVAESTVEEVQASAGNGESGVEKESEPLEAGAAQTVQGRPYEGRRKPGLMIQYDFNPDRSELGWLAGNVFTINTGHPAYKKAVEDKTETYHNVISVAWVLSGYLEGEKSVSAFLNRFLSGWGSV